MQKEEIIAVTLVFALSKQTNTVIWLPELGEPPHGDNQPEQEP
jgi:hypothetical protein